MSFKIDSQISENQIEADIANYLGYITPFWSSRFRLESVDEQSTGADKLFNKFIPIYLQFKVSHGLNSNVQVPSQFIGKPLEKIISYRSNSKLSGNPILYFQLRKKAQKATEFQHNILFSLNQKPNQFGLYVAPLTLDLAEYEKALNSSLLTRIFTKDPFYYKNIEIIDTQTSKGILFKFNPFLRHHISIPPHILTQTHNHHYSYSKSGGDVVWHGGEILNDDFRLSNQLSQIYDFAYGKNVSWFNEDNYVEFIRQFQSENIDLKLDELNDLSKELTIMNFSKILKQKFNIKLMLLTSS